MKALIVLNGDKTTKLPSSYDYDYIVIADGGYEKAKDQLSKIHLVIGDFDSLGYVPEGVKTSTFKAEKDTTDGEEAMMSVLNVGATEVDIYWALGGRLDHTLGNLAMLQYFHEHGCFARIITDNEIVSMYSGTVNLHGVRGKTISLLPYSDKVHIIDTKGLKYPATNLNLCKNRAIGVSNVALDDDIEICSSVGEFLLIINM